MIVFEIIDRVRYIEHQPSRMLNKGRLLITVIITNQVAQSNRKKGRSGLLNSIRISLLKSQFLNVSCLGWPVFGTLLYQLRHSAENLQKKI